VIVVLAAIAVLLRMLYNFIAPALPFIVGLAFFLLVIACALRRPRGW
jgi:hypothetical protein